MTGNVKGTLLVAAVAMAGVFTSCSETDAPEAPGEGSPSVETSPLKVTNDQDYLGQYVTNYKSAARSRAAENSFEMPVPCPEFPDDAWEYDYNKTFNVGYDWSVSLDQAKVAKITGDVSCALANIGQTFYVTGNWVITGVCDSSNAPAGTVNIYLYEGGSITFGAPDNNGLSNGLPHEINIYNFGGTLNMPADANADNVPKISGKINIYTTTVYDFPYSILEGGKLYALDGIDVTDLTLNNGEEVYTGCNAIINGKLTIDNGSMLSTNYVKASKMEIKANAEMPERVVLYDGGLWEVDELYLRNVDHIVLGAADGEGCLISAGFISANLLDLSSTFQNAYIDCTNWGGNDNIASDLSNLVFSPTAHINNHGDFKVLTSDETGSCSAKLFVKPSAPVDPTPKPSPLEVISKVEMDHHHPISATGIDVYGNQAFVSWHERGNNIKGCIEVLNITSPNEVTFEAWMETAEYKAGGVLSDNAYDFNHIVYDPSSNSILTVGDHSKKGGFVAMIDLNKTFGTGSKVGENINVLIPRQIPFAASGNCVARYKDDLYIAGAGGYSIFPFDEDGKKFPIVNSSKDDYTLQSQCDSLKTLGSAKHLAINGTTVATIEYTNKGADKLPARISLWNAENWIKGTPTTSWTVENFGPTNGKDVIALDDTYVYSCQGTNGMAVYDLTGNEVARFQVNDYLTKDNGFTDTDRNKMRNSAANGLCVYGDYVFVANGGAGLWILDKKLGFKPVGHFTDAGSYFTLENNETEKIGASCNYVRVTDSGYVYVAYGLGGVIVLKFDPSKI